MAHSVVGGEGLLRDFGVRFGRNGCFLAAGTWTPSARLAQPGLIKFQEHEGPDKQLLAARICLRVFLSAAVVFLGDLEKGVLAACHDVSGWREEGLRGHANWDS